MATKIRRPCWHATPFYIVACFISCISAQVNARLRQTRTQSQDAMAKAHTALRELDDTKTQFFANVSHELRTPLTLIIAPIEAMLRSPQTPPQFTPQLKICHRGALRLLRLVDDILALTRLQSTQPRLLISPCKFIALVTQLTDQIQPWAERKGLTLTFMPSSIPAAQIECDEVEIERLVFNLLGNAVKFTPQGGNIAVSIEGDGEGLHLTVRDTGPGIPAASVDKIFEPYYQVDKSNERRSSGTGLGLSLCKSIVELHGGRIWVESVEGRGTTMHVWLAQLFSRDRLVPRLRNTLEVLHSDAARVASEEWQESLRRDEAYRMLPFIDASERRNVLRGPKKPGCPMILVVEDNVDLQQFVSGLLSDTYEVYSAFDGAAGLQMARDIHPDLIVSDIMMPQMDGFSLARALREDTRTSDIPIVLLTARAEQNDKMMGYEVGADAYLPKPFNSTELRLVCERLVKRKAHGQRATRALYDAHLRMFIAEVSHEILNPLNFINTAAFVLHRSACAQAADVSKTQAAQQAYQSVSEGVTRVRDVVAEMRRHIEGGAQAPKHPTTAQAVIDRTLRLLGHATQLTVVNDTRRSFMAQRGQIEQVLVNLVLNAQQATQAPAQIALAAHEEADAIAIAVVDCGPGIPAQQLDRVFEPFFTTKSEGTGLGLAISRQIMQEHGGDLCATVNPEGGMTFKLTVPVANPLELRGPAPAPAPKPEAC